MKGLALLEKNVSKYSRYSSLEEQYRPIAKELEEKEKEKQLKQKEIDKINTKYAKKSRKREDEDEDNESKDDEDTLCGSFSSLDLENTQVPTTQHLVPPTVPTTRPTVPRTQPTVPAGVIPHEDQKSTLSNEEWIKLEKKLEEMKKQLDHMAPRVPGRRNPPKATSILKDK